MEKDKKLLNLQDNIMNLVEEYYNTRFSDNVFVPGVSEVPVSGKVFNEKELKNLIQSSLDFWLTDGEYSETFSDLMSDFLSIKHVRLVNSGSSANLVSLSALTNKKIKNHLNEGDEVITAAVGFPTTVNPIFQNNLIPVFVDSELGTYNPDFSSIEKAYSPDSKVIMLAHTLGNPLQIEKIKDFASDKGMC